MRANAIPLLAIFETKTRLEVPLFQRQYVWGREQQWEPLWEDISRKFEDYLAGRKDGPVHFLGAMVLDQKQTATGHVEKRQVIDGQQRLTTLQIFLAALRDFCSENQCPELASECEGFLYNKGMMSSPEDRFKVWPTNLDRAQFQDVIESRSRVELERRHPLTKKPYARRYDPRPRMIEAYCFFYDSLHEFFDEASSSSNGIAHITTPMRLEECFSALKNALQVVSIDLDRDDDAQVIFETLNARGEPLFPADLLRNYIFLRAARKEYDQEKLYHEYWERFDDDFWREPVIQGRLVRPRSDLFMQHFLASQLATDIPIRHLFVEYKYWIETRRPFDNVRDELAVLAQYGDAFRRLISPVRGDSIYEIASVLAMYDISTAYPLLLQLLGSSLAETTWQGVSRILESYIIRRAVCGYTTKGYNRTFLSATRLVRSEECLDSALDGFLSNQPSSSQKVLYPLIKRTEISAALSQIQYCIRSAPRSIRCIHKIGNPGGAGHSRLTWIPNLGFWVCIESYESRGDRHWIAYGVVDPRSTKSALNIRVESSLSHRGMNRRIAGLLGKDSENNTYLLHSGKIGGGKKGVGKAFFWKHYGGDRVDVRFEDRDIEYATIGRIGAPDFIERLADFVHGIDALCDGNRKYHWRSPDDSATRPFSDKRGGVSEALLPQRTMLHDREHDVVLNALAITLDRRPNVASVREDFQRDLRIILKNGTTIDIELKTTVDRYAIYTAVGQLLLNQDVRRRSALVLVTPSEVRDAVGLRSRLQDLSIMHAGYDISAGRASFRGLDAILSKLEASAEGQAPQSDSICYNLHRAPRSGP